MHRGLYPDRNEIALGGVWMMLPALKDFVLVRDGHADQIHDAFRHQIAQGTRFPSPSANIVVRAMLVGLG
jgi:hypothetical protein